MKDNKLKSNVKTERLKPEETSEEYTDDKEKNIKGNT